MRTKLSPFALPLVLWLAVSLAPAPGTAEMFDACQADPTACVWGGIEALLWQRVPRFGNQPVVVDPADGTPLLWTGDVEDEFNPGLRAVVGKRWGDSCWGGEFVFMSLCDATASTSLTAAQSASGQLAFPGALGAASNVFNGSDQIDYEYSSALYGAELNLLRLGRPSAPGKGGKDDKDDKDEEKSACCGTGPFLVPFVGFRYLLWKDRVGLYGQRDEEGGTETGSYRVDADNNLFGAQLGLRARRGGHRFGWDAAAKAGIFGNQATQSQVVIDYPQFPLRPETSRTGGNVAFAGELSLSAIYRITDVWAARAGYNLMWIEGVALAPDQLDFTFTSTSGTGLDYSGVFLHGVSLGLEACW